MDADKIAVEKHTSREDWGSLALESQRRTTAALSLGELVEEIVPILVPLRQDHDKWELGDTATADAEP